MMTSKVSRTMALGRVPVSRWLIVSCALLVICGCALFIDQRIKQSEAQNYALVVTAIREIEAGVREYAYAYEVLRDIEPAMRDRLRYFEGEKPDAAK